MENSETEGAGIVDVLFVCFVLWCDYKLWPVAKYFWVNGPAIFDGVVVLYYLFNLYLAVNLLMIFEQGVSSFLDRFGW